MKYKHIIWDYNGTLLNDVFLCTEVINELLVKRELPQVSTEKYKNVFDFPVKDYYARIGFDFSIEPFEVVGTEFIEKYNLRISEAKLHDGMIEILVSTQNNGFVQHVLSAREESSLKDELHQLKILPFFTEVAGLNNHYAGGKITVGKELIKNLACHVSEILMIGDTVHDFETAEAMGIDSVLISHGHQNYEKLKSCGVEVYKSPQELGNFLNQIQNT